MLMNIGFTEALRLRSFDCFVFHDVDLLPEDDRNSYACPEVGEPRHLSVAINTFGYRYKRLFFFSDYFLNGYFVFQTYRSESFWRS